MKRSHRQWIFLTVFTGALAWLGSDRLASVSAQEAASSYEAERAKALKNPYANDLGPETIDVSGYPADLQATYKEVFQVKCARCHTAARPLNSQFVEPAGPKDQQAGRVAEWKTSQPDLFKDKLVWQVEGKTGAQAGIWERYVKRMMAKPGCNISPADGKKIWEFLRYDSEKRKTGANAAAWAAHRRKLLADFKAKHPDRYRELYETH
jgi:hypothetical protein